MRCSLTSLGCESRVVLACGLMFAMSYMYLMSANVPAWHSWQTLPFYVVVDLALGAAVYPLFVKELVMPSVYAVVNAVLQLLAAVTIALEGAHFASVGPSPVPFVVGTVLVAVSAVVAFRSKANGSRGMVIAACILTVVGVAVARYAYYAASIL